MHDVVHQQYDYTTLLLNSYDPIFSKEDLQHKLQKAPRTKPNPVAEAPAPAPENDDENKEVARDPETQRQVDDFMHELVDKDNRDPPNLWKVQFKKQSNRHSIVVLSAKPLNGKGSWSQKCQIVLKDGLPGWAACMIMRQIHTELCGGCCSPDTVKARRDELVQLIYDGKWLQSLQDMLDTIGSDVPPPGVVELVPENMATILRLQSELPVKQHAPVSTKPPPTIKRMAPLVASKESLTSSVDQAPATGSGEFSSTKGGTENPDNAETQIIPEG